MADGGTTRERMTPEDLEAILSSEYASSLGGNRSSELSDEREKALDYYNGDMTEDMPSLEGRSSAVSMDVQETVEGLMPGMMEIFSATDEAVKFNAVGPEDEEGAEQETDYINHVLMQKNPGFLILYSFIKDALLSKVGIVKIYWDEYEKQSRETYLDQSDDVYSLLVADPNIEIVEHTEHVDENWRPGSPPSTGSPMAGPDGPMPMAAAPSSTASGGAAPLPSAEPVASASLPALAEQAPMLHDVTILTKKNIGCARVENVPPEEFGISRWARSLTDATYTYHRTRTTVADLISQGFDEDEVKRLPTSSGADSSQEEVARDTVGEESDETGSGSDDDLSNRRVEVIEEYCMCDYDGTGKPSLYRVTRAGGNGQILNREGEPAIEPVDEHPFAGMTPVIVTHRFFGKSIADLVLDIQKIKTALLRGLLDNVYLSNNNRLEVAEALSNERTIDDLLINRPGALVRVKMPGAVTPIANQPMGDFVFPMMEFVDQTKEFRTGVSKLGAGQDPNVLQNTTALATDKAFSATQEKRNLIARIFAETGIKDMMLKLHSVIRKNDREANTVKLRNKWITVNPREWRERNDLTINVGLGTGSKREKLQGMMLLATQQKEALAFPQFGLVKPKHLYNTAKQITSLLDLKNVELYFLDPESPEGQATAQAASQQPDPAMVELQGKMQIEQLQAQADIATQDRKTEAEIALKQKQFEFDSQLAMLNAQIEQEKARQTQLPDPVALGKLELEKQRLLTDQAQFVAQHHLAVAQHNQQLVEQTNTDLAGPDTQGKDGKTVADSLVSAMRESEANLMQMIHQQGQLLTQLAALVAAPAEIIRDPITQRVTGARKVLQ